MSLYLVRHAETVPNRDGVGLGRSDVPLTPKGERQAMALARTFGRLSIAEVWSSPQLRARRTAEAVAEATGARLVVSPALAELDVGAAEGLPLAEVRRRWPEFVAAWRGPAPETVRMPGGESLQDVAERLQPALPSIREGAARGLVLVSHAFTLRVLACTLLGLPLASFRAFACDLASVSVIDVGPPAVVRRWNDTCHLLGLEPGGVAAYGG